MMPLNHFQYVLNDFGDFCVIEMEGRNICGGCCACVRSIAHHVKPSNGTRYVHMQCRGIRIQ